VKISYRNKFLDILRFSIFHYSRSPIVLGAFGFLLLVLTQITWEGVAESSVDSIFIKILFFTFVEALWVFLIAFFALLIIILSNISKMNKTVLADTVLTLGSDGITSESQYGRSELKWNAIQKAVRTRSYIFIYLMQHGAIVIPRRAFSTNDEREQFWLICQAKSVPINDKAG
jgi:hypothetical protein